MNYEALPGIEDALKLVQEKKAAKDYDGDGKVESGSKEHAGAVHNAIQRKKGLKADGKDTRAEGYDNTKGNRHGDGPEGTAKRKAALEKKRGMKLDDHPQFKEHHEKDAEGKVIEHEVEEDLEEGMKAARDNVGASTCWKGYVAKGTKTKGGKEVPNCVPANEELETMEASLMESGLFSDDEVRYIIGEKFDELEELYKGKHGQSEKEYQDGRSDGGKMVSGDSKGSGASYSSRAVKNSGPNPAGGSKKPQGQGRMTSGARADLKLRKANMKAGK